VIGLRPHELRAMTPKDVATVFDGWNRSHEPKRAGSDAPTREEYRAMLRKIDGGHR
jgi:hypothetical protein